MLSAHTHNANLILRLFIGVPLLFEV